MLGGSDDAPIIPAELQLPIPGIEIVANLGAIPVGESPDAMARRLADEKFVFEAKVRIDDFMDRLGLEQETLIFCPVQDKIYFGRLQLHNYF